MIDVHHHCLPATDDGPRDLEEAVDLCLMAADEGIETIVATPHVMRGRWQNTSRPRLQATLESLRQKLGPTPRLLLGSEYFFAHDMAEVLESGTGIIPLAGSRYVLVEFNSSSVPPLIEQAFYRVQMAGWTPLIAHPERNLVFQSRPDLLAMLVERGARTQVTAASFLGDFGRDAASSANRWLSQGLIHVIASDAHNTTRRPPRIRAAMDVLVDLAGERIVRALTIDNPAAIIAGQPLPYEPEITGARMPAGFLGRLKRFFQS